MSNLADRGGSRWQRPPGFRSLRPRSRWRSALRQVLAHLSWLAVDEDEDGGAAGAQRPVNLVALLTMRRKRAGDLSICVSPPGSATPGHARPPPVTHLFPVTTL